VLNADFSPWTTFNNENDLIAKKNRMTLGPMLQNYHIRSIDVKTVIFRGTDIDCFSVYFNSEFTIYGATDHTDITSTKK
jgi:hypothetical protein